MKGNKAPKKIYIFEQDFQRKDHKVMYGVNQDKDIKGLIEYTRTDAFFEKAVSWLKNCLDNGMWIANDVGVKEKDAIIENFRNYMEGE